MCEFTIRIICYTNIFHYYTIKMDSNKVKQASVDKASLEPVGSHTWQNKIMVPAS